MINYFRRQSLKKRLKNVFDVTLMDHDVPHLLIFFGVCGLILGFCILMLFADTHPEYHATLTEGGSQVYDGDTLKDVIIKIYTFKEPIHPDKEKELWPGVWQFTDGIYVETDIRIAGIDTPEKRASTKNPDGTKRSEASRNREKAASAAARQALIDLLAKNKYKFVVHSPEFGKYAGRTVASVEVLDQDVARYLIQKGHAKAYDGGTKPQWNWGE